MNSLNSISFKAAPVFNDVEIMKKNSVGKYEPYKATLIEFDLNMPEDVSKIKEICATDGFKSFGTQLRSDLFNHDTIFSYKNRHCFALVNNSETNFSNINKDNVLGIYTIYEPFAKESLVKIAYFMTKNDYKYVPNKFPQFKEIGREMYNSIKRYFPNKVFEGYSAIDAKQFWQKMGLKEVADRVMRSVI